LLLLILARNERGLTVREETDLATAAEDVLDTVGLGGLRVHATLEPAVISGDPVLAERLIANLVDNAVRYNVAAGDIWISTRTTAGSSQLTVANAGPVISPADAERIFQPFQRLSDRTSHDGSGLGLAIVASIAAVHGGTAAGLSRVQAPPAWGPMRRSIFEQASTRPGLALDQLTASSSIMNGARKVGLVQAATVKSSRGGRNRTYLFSPLIQAADDVLLTTEALHLRKLFVAHILFGQEQAIAGWGRIRDPTVLVRALLNRGQVGPATNISTDYHLVEAAAS